MIDTDTDHDNVTGTEEEEVGDHYGSCSTPARPGHLHTHRSAVSSAVGCSAAGLLPYYEQSNLLALSLKHNWAISWKFERQPLCCIHPAGSKKLEVSGGKIIVLLH